MCGLSLFDSALGMMVEDVRSNGDHISIYAILRRGGVGFSCYCVHKAGEGRPLIFTLEENKSRPSSAITCWLDALL